MNIIEITGSNYWEYQSLDIVAFSFAYEGAMGEMGAIYIIDRDGKIYHANYCQGDERIDPSHINDIILYLRTSRGVCLIVCQTILIGNLSTCSLGIIY